tara:strand:- start:705 stop:1763 length:1059 start_codon:yes stop_codon:yes gene_type:complete
MKRKTIIAFCVSGILLAATINAEEDEKLFSFKQPHMGTEFTILVWANQSQSDDLTLVVEQAFDRVNQLNQICSDYFPLSEINDLARAPAKVPFPVSPDLYHLLFLSKELTRESEGAFDVTAGPLVRLWRLSKKNSKLPTPEQLERAKARTGADHLTLDTENQTVTKHVEGMLFDLGGIAKGYAADAAFSILRDAGYRRTLVAASGDIVAGDPPPGKAGWIVGIETLELEPDPNQLNTITLANRAISTSGDARQYIEVDGTRYSHIVSTKTGLGLTERIAASVIAKCAADSDRYATVVTLLGEKDGLQFIENKRGIECRIVALHNGQESVIQSHGFSKSQEKEVIKESPVTSP